MKTKKINLLSALFTLTLLSNPAFSGSDSKPDFGIAKQLISENYQLKEKLNHSEKERLNLSVENEELNSKILNKDSELKKLKAGYYDLKTQSLELVSQANKVASIIASINGENSNSASIQQTQQVAKVEITKESTDETDEKEEAGSQDGSANNDYIALTPNKPAMFKNSIGNIRLAPNPRAKIIRQTKKDKFVFLDQKTKYGTWFKIAGEEAWVYKSLLIMD